MKNYIFKPPFFYVCGAFAIFVAFSLILQNLLFALILGGTFLLFTSAIVAMTRKLVFLEKQNSINLERFAISIEHVNNVLFDNVLEADITNDSLIGENAENLTKLLEIPTDSSYSKTIEVICERMVDPEYCAEYRKTLSVENILETLDNGLNTIEYECVERSDGKNYRWIRVHYCIYQSAVSNSVKIISYVKNIEEEKRAYSSLIAKAATDQMTGVLNKMSTKDTVSNLLKKYSDESNIILMIDIDNFKNVNDVYGHDVGDEVIIAICNIIKASFRDTDIIGRMGGDEFLVCLREKFNQDNIEIRVERLLAEVQKFSAEFDCRNTTLITVSIGIVNTFGNENFDQLYHYADTAMYKAKALGKNRYCLYDYID